MNTAIESVEIDVSLVHRLISVQFPHWASLPIRPVGLQGNDNRMFRLGDKMSARLPSASRYAAAVEKEHTWLPRLAQRLPLQIPIPLALGEPSDDYPWHWSVYRWLDGEAAETAHVGDLQEFARSLAGFLISLHAVDGGGGPPAGEQTFHRGGLLSVYDGQTREAIAALGEKIDTRHAIEIWEAALAAAWRNKPVWFHGDVSVGNLLVTNGRLNAVIDFGTAGVGDPACDLTIAWTLFEGKSRDLFRSTQPADAGMWARARGWVLWKALIVHARQLADSGGESRTIWTHNPSGLRIIDEVIADHQRGF